LIVPGRLPFGEEAHGRLRKTFDLPPDLQLLARSHAGFVSVRIADLLSEEFVRKLPDGLRQSGLGQLDHLIRSLALKPSEIERASLQILPGGPLVFVQTTKGFERDKVLKGLRLNAREEKIKGKTVHVDAKQRATFYPVDDRVFVVGSTEAVKQLLEADASKAPDKLHLDAVNQAAGKHHIVVATVRGDIVVRSMGYLLLPRNTEAPQTAPSEKNPLPKDNGPELKDRPLPAKDKDGPARVDGPCTSRTLADDKPGTNESTRETADASNDPTLDDLLAESNGFLLPFKPLLTAKYSWWCFDLGPEAKVETRATYADEEDAKDGETAVKSLLYVLREGLQLALVGELAVDLKKSPNLLSLIKSIQESFRKASVTRDGAVVRSEVRLKLEPKTLLAATEEMKKLGARSTAANDLRQLSLAMLTYHDNFGTFPGPAIYDADGKPLLSWRVAILPWIGETALYEKFKRDEPWDSDHNKKLIEKMPSVFAPKGGKTNDPYVTYYQVFVGPNAMFDPASARRGPISQGRRITHVTDGTSNTLMIVEALNPVPWTKPDDIPFDASKAPPKLGGVFADGFHVAFVDGNVVFLKKSIDPKVLTGLITPNGGEVVDWSKWDITRRSRRFGRGDSSGSATGTAPKSDAPPPPPKDLPKPKDKP
jgi:hypothetical protein